MARTTAVSARLDAGRLVQAIGEAREPALRKLAADALAEGLQQNERVLGHRPGFTTIVDGGPAPLSAMRSGSVVVHRFTIQGAVVDDIIQEFMKLAPYKAGNYRDSIVLIMNGAVVEPPVEVGPDDDVIVSNTAAYARRIERGWSDQAPDGVFETIHAILHKRHGNAVSMGFTYVGLSGGGLASRMDENKSEYRYPAIIVGPPGQMGRRRR